MVDLRELFEPDYDVVSISAIKQGDKIRQAGDKEYDKVRTVQIMGAPLGCNRHHIHINKDKCFDRIAMVDRKRG